MAWNVKVLDILEIGVFAHYVSFVDDGRFPQLQEYCVKYYPLVQDLAKEQARHHSDYPNGADGDAED